MKPTDNLLLRGAELRANAARAMEIKVLEMIVSGLPLTETLYNLTLQMEELAPDMRSSVLLLDKDGLHLRHGAAPSLPEAYTRAIDGLAIGPNVGSCGTAAFRREQVIVADIANDPLWADFRVLALSYGLKACWSTPIFGEQGRVLGTFAMYFCQPGRPTAEQLRAINLAVHLAAIAIGREQTEAALRESELKNAKMVANIGDVIVILDPDGVNRYESPNLEKLFGWRPEEVVGLSTLANVHPEDVDSVRKFIGSLLGEPNATGTTQYRFRCKDGSYKWIELTAVNLLHDSDILGILGNYQDITERKKSEDAVVASEARFRAIIDASPIPMALNDDQQRITFLNPAFVQTFGYDQSDIPTLAEWWPKAYPDPEYRQWVVHAWQAELARAAQTNSAFTPLEIRARCKDGTERFVMASTASLATGFEETHLVLMYDISERKRVEQRLKVAHADAEVASRAKSEFLANMSHEIRTPLTAILGFADILREDCEIPLAPEQRLQTVDTIKNAGMHLLSVINDILDLSKIEADKMTVEHVDSPLVRILCEVESLMRPQAARKGLVLSVALSSPLPDRILCDPTRLRQILMNLVGNATKFTETGSVAITAGVEGQDGQSRLVIDIEDTGPGMTPEHTRRLFIAFGQVDSSMTRKQGGTGLGLTLSRRVARMLGGDVTLVHTELGKGSCFRLVLPLERVAGSAVVTSLSSVKESGLSRLATESIKLSGRILLAEDGFDNQRLIVFLLRKSGAKVETANNGCIALDMLDQAETAGTPFDLLLTDMQMPEMDGYTLATTLRERGSTIPIVALTAHAMAEDRDKCMKAGCDDYATKPIDKATLFATCAKWMGKPGGAHYGLLDNGS